MIGRREKGTQLLETPPLFKLWYRCSLFNSLKALHVHSICNEFLKSRECLEVGAPDTAHPYLQETPAKTQGQGLLL